MGSGGPLSLAACGFGSPSPGVGSEFDAVESLIKRIKGEERHVYGRCSIGQL